jgi:hypothetical protein
VAGQLQALQGLGHAGAGVGAGQARQAIRHVLPDRQVREQPVALRHVADAPALDGHVDAAGGVEDGLAADPHVAGVGPQDADDAA